MTRHHYEDAIANRQDAESSFDEPLFVSSIIAAGMALGLIVPGLADLLAPAVLPSLFMIVLASLIPFRTMLSGQLLEAPSQLIKVVGWLQLVLPALVLAMGLALDVPDIILPFVLLSACSGAVFASPALAHLFGLDREQAARIMILSTLLMPFSLALFVGPLVGMDNLYAFEIFGLRVAVFLILPIALVIMLRVLEHLTATEDCNEACVAQAERIDTYSTRLGMLALAVFAAGIMQGVAEHVASEPGLMLALFCGALAVNLGMMAATRLALHPLGIKIAHTASIIAMTRNVGLAYAMTATFFGPMLAQYVALCQVPLLVGPVLLRLWQSKLVVASKNGPKPA